MSLDALQSMNGRLCACGREHRHAIDTILCGSGVLHELPALLKRRNIQKPFVFCDGTTVCVAGERVRNLLDRTGFSNVLYALDDPFPEPNEKAVGSMCMHFDASCDAIVAVGSGVINDLGKVLATLTKRPYAIVATAPSVDGYASATSSMDRDGLKISLQSKCADIIIGDTDVLKNAPEKSLISGLGDIIAKYISVAEWRISHLINGEYYCDDIAALMRNSVKICAENAEGLKNREDKAVEAVFRGLCYAGAAMSFAKASRPASGNEHYFSHIWDMRALEFGTASSTHGIQCAIGTLICAGLYEKLRDVVPNAEKAREYARKFDLKSHEEELRRFLGRGADTLIELEKTENKYSLKKHGERFSVITERFGEILKIISEEIPSEKAIADLLDSVSCPKTPEEIGIDSSTVPDTFRLTKDIRDKYILSRLVFDLGLEDEFCGYLTENQTRGEN